MCWVSPCCTVTHVVITACCMLRSAVFSSRLIACCNAALFQPCCWGSAAVWHGVLAQSVAAFNAGLNGTAVLVWCCCSWAIPACLHRGCVCRHLPLPKGRCTRRPGTNNADIACKDAVRVALLSLRCLGVHGSCQLVAQLCCASSPGMQLGYSLGSECVLAWHMQFNACALLRMAFHVLSVLMCCFVRKHGKHSIRARELIAQQQLLRPKAHLVTGHDTYKNFQGLHTLSHAVAVWCKCVYVCARKQLESRRLLSGPPCMLLLYMLRQAFALGVALGG